MKRRDINIKAVLFAGAAALLAIGQVAQAQDLERGNSEDADAETQPPAIAVPVTSLSAALELAYSTNPNLLAERARLESVDYRLPQARSRSGPQLSFESSYGYRRDNIEQSAGGYLPLTGWAPSAAAVFSQPLLTFGRNAASERTASAQIDYQRALLRATTQQVLLETVNAYVSVGRDREAVRIAQENLALLERDLTDNLSRMKAADTTRTDVQQVATRVEVGRAQLLQAQRSAAMSEAYFLKIVGSVPGELEPPLPFGLPASNLEDAYAMAQRANPVLAAAHARERVSRAQVGATKAERRPRLDLRGRAGVDTNLFGLDRLQQTSLRGEVVLSGPIFQSGALSARLNEAEAANDADWRLIDQTLRDVRAEVADAWNESLTAEASLQNLGRAVTLAEQAHDGAVQQQRYGMRTTLDVLDLARDLLSAKVSYNQARASAHVAKVKLLFAVGVLEDVVPRLGMPSHDIEEHYERARNDGDVPLITASVQALDRIPLGSDENREFRDEFDALLSPEVEVPTWGPVVGNLFGAPNSSGLARALADRAAQPPPLQR